MVITGKVVKVLTLVIFLCSAVQVMAEPVSSDNQESHFLQKGHLAGQFGFAGNYLNNHQESVSDVAAIWGLLELSYTTPSLYGIQTGAGIVTALQIDNNQPGDFRMIFKDELDMKILFASYDFFESSNTVLAGRTQFQLNPATRGESHQGIQFVTDTKKPVSLAASVINRWIHHSSTSFDADGITGWEAVDSINNQASDVFYSATLSMRWEDTLTAIPFINHQNQVMTVFGTQLMYTKPLQETWQLAFNGIFAIYSNNVPEEIQPDYGDVTSALFHTSVGQGKNTIGVGWYYISDDKGTLNTGVFSAFDPLKEDDLFPYNDQNNCELFFIDSHFEYGSFSTDIAFGYGNNKAIDGYSWYVDLWLYYNL